MNLRHILILVFFLTVVPNKSMGAKSMCGDLFMKRSESFRLFMHATSQPKKGTVLLVHAMFRNSDYFNKPHGKSFVSYLNNNGYDVVRVNLSGYIASKQLNKTISFKTYVGDIEEAISRVVARDQQPIFIIGHSLGGVASLVAGQNSKVSGIISVASSVWSFSNEPQPIRNFTQKIKTGLALLITEVFGYLPASKMGLGDIDAPLQYSREYWHWIKTRTFTSIDGERDYKKTIEDGEVPTLFVSGKKDLNMAPVNNIKWLQSLTKDNDFMEVSEKNGFGFNGDHFSVIYGRNAAQNVWPKLREWLDSKSQE